MREGAREEALFPPPFLPVGVARSRGYAPSHQMQKDWRGMWAQSHKGGEEAARR